MEKQMIGDSDTVQRKPDYVDDKTFNNNLNHIKKLFYNNIEINVDNFSDLFRIKTGLFDIHGDDIFLGDIILFQDEEE